MAGRRKQRVTQHLMEEESFMVLKGLLPSDWVLHEYRPDYGIDLTIEPFEPVGLNISETLGEHLFVQLKSVRLMKTRVVKVSPRYNVEKRPLKSHSDSSKDEIEIEAIPFQIDTNDLVTVQAMGAAATVLLVLVELSTKRTFFLCLNDLIDKIVFAEDPAFAEKGAKQILIPTRNEITQSADSLLPIRMYSKRAKFYTAFAKFAYQQHEIQYACAEPICDESPEEAFVNSIRHFIDILRRLTIWDASEYWPLVGDYRGRIDRLESILDGHQSTPLDIQAEAEILWQGLNALGRTFEEVVREWFLPTYFGGAMP